MFLEKLHKATDEEKDKLILEILGHLFPKKKQWVEVEVIVARYNEEISWLNNDIFRGHSITCYNKGDPLPHIDSYKVVDLPNVGRCDHTFLYHVIQNYDNLADVTCFLPGSCMDPHKKHKTLFVVDKAITSKNSVLHGNRCINVQRDIYGFIISHWAATNRENLKKNPESILLECPIRPFGAWYEHNFSGFMSTVIAFFGIFAIHRDHILQHPKSHYEKLIKFVDHHSNPEAGHYMERSWHAVFGPMPNSCIY